MTYHKTCSRCGAEFEAKNTGAKYCPRCRVEYNSRTPKPCRCKMPSALVVGYGFPADGSRTRHVICMQCGRRGPDAKTPSEAIKACNKEN
jgi:DNA-directed RNA polymerase subunit RPC12/RpoP